MTWRRNWTADEVDKCAREGARRVHRDLGINPKIPPQIGVVLGTGWGDSVNPVTERVTLLNLPGFASLGNLPGHARSLALANIGGHTVVVQFGRVHMNEHPTDPAVPAMVRLQVALMHALGVRTLVLTNACGSLNDKKVKPGDVILIDGFIPMGPAPVFGGEFRNPEDTIHRKHLPVIREHLQARELGPVHTGGYVYKRGPLFEGRRYEKPNLARHTRCLCVGMSTYPECAVADVLGMRTLPISCVSNTAQDTHDHEGNIRLLHSHSARLGHILTTVVEIIASR